MPDDSNSVNSGTRASAMAPDASTSPVGHTPGPWDARPDERDNGEWEVVKPDPHKPSAEDPWFICACFDSADGHEAAANARLIAAAPELLEALEAFARTEVLEPNGVIVGLERYHFERARAAIAKARGGQA